MSDAADEIMQTVAAGVAARSGRPVDEVIAEMRQAQTTGVPAGVGEAIARISRESLAGRGIPERHLRAVYDKEPTACDALTHVHAFVTSSDTLLVLMGNVGTCKSGSAAWALTQKSGRFISAQDLARAAIGKDDESIRTWRACKSVGLLVIDDIGTEFTSDWLVAAVNEMVNVRYEACVKTLLTVNATATTAEAAAAQFKAKYGARITDRANEAGGFVVLAGRSVRGRK